MLDLNLCLNKVFILYNFDLKLEILWIMISKLLTSINFEIISYDLPTNYFRTFQKDIYFHYFFQ